MTDIPVDNGEPEEEGLFGLVDAVIAARKRAMATEPDKPEALKSCPFCGGTDIRTYRHGEHAFSQCYDCTACGPDQKGQRHWNTRAEDFDALRLALTARGVLVAELVGALAEMEREKSDYMIRNKLGDPADEYTNIMARNVIARARAMLTKETNEVNLTEHGDQGQQGERVTTRAAPKGGPNPGGRDRPPGSSLIRAHGYGCMCNLCRGLPIQEHPDAFE